MNLTGTALGVISLGIFVVAYVLVMAEDPAIRANRLALLRGIAQTMNRVADISKLAV